MASIATLAVQLTARTKQFTKKMAKSKRAIKGLSKGVSAAAARMSLFNLKALAAGATVGGLALLTRNAMKNIDAMAKVSDKLGLSTEALGGLRHAAELTGVPIRSLDMGIQRMTRRIAEASTGTGEAKAAIKELGLDARKLAQLTVDQQFFRIAEAMESVTSQSNKVRLGFKLFDSEGVALISTLALGADGLMEMRREAEQLGVAINRVDARKVEQANDEFTKLQGALKGIVNKFAVEMSPLMAKAAFDITEWGKDGAHSSSQISKGINGVIQSVAFLADTWNVVRIAQLKSQRFILNGMQEIIRAVKTVNQLTGDFWNMQKKNSTSAVIAGFPGGVFISALLGTSEKFRKFLSKPIFEPQDFSEVEALQAQLDDIDQTIADIEEKKPGQSILDWADRAREQFNGMSESVKGVTDEIAALQKKVGDAKQVRFSRFAIRDISSDALSIVKSKLGGSSQSEQLVKDPQLATTNQLLGTMLNQARGFGLA